MAGERLTLKALCFKEDVTKYEMIDEIKRQYTEYQTEVIEEDSTVPPIVRARDKQQSYWRKAYSRLDMPLDDAGDRSERIDCYLLRVRIYQYN